MNTILLNGIERDVLTQRLAEELGYRPMTYACHPENELWILNRIAKDMDRAGHHIVLVEQPDPHQHDDECVWLEIWRRVFRKSLRKPL